jgi:hypothetical protein
MFRQFQIVTILSHLIFMNSHLHVLKHVLGMLLSKYVCIKYCRRNMALLLKGNKPNLPKVHNSGSQIDINTWFVV